MVRRLLFLLLAVVVAITLAVAAVVALNLRGEAALPDHEPSIAATPAQVERGRYLALAGNCAGCHTARGGAAYAGGVGIDTPFGTVYAGNLTPDARTGLGRWSAAEFWRAMHHGRSKDGRLLYPAFPYPSFTRVTREDADALHAWLRTLPPVEAPNLPHKLRFPYGTQAALAVWRALSFAPAPFVPDTAKPAEWNRGAYLVTGLGHCIACHGERNAIGATREQRGLGGGTLTVDRWYAPSLTSKREASVADWPADEVVALLKTGKSAHGSVLGPMADVVFRSTQHLSDADLGAIATYLRQLPDTTPPQPQPVPPPRRDAGVLERGARIYDQRCAYCHGAEGEGTPGAYPPLAGNRAVTLRTPVNLVEAVRRGGFLPSTAGNPRPFGMPPFGHLLDDNEIAAVLTYVRGAWGNDAPPVTAADMLRR